MYYAQDEQGKRIHANFAKIMKKQTYYCPFCKSEVFLKIGTMRTSHFAHKSIAECDDFSHDMSEWHLSWQAMFPEDCQEVVCINRESGEKHRADVLIHNTFVIEFQHSPISSVEFNRRNAFYISCGYYVIWVFDFKEKYDTRRISAINPQDDLSKSDNWIWKNSSPTFINWTQKDKVHVYFQFSYGNGEKEFTDGVIKRVERTFTNAGTISLQSFSTYGIESGKPTNGNLLVEWIDKAYKSLSSQKEEAERRRFHYFENNIFVPKSIPELWNEDYEAFAIENVITHKSYSVYDVTGQLGKRRNLNAYPYSNGKTIFDNGKVIYDWNKPEWRVLRATWRYKEPDITLDYIKV